MSSARREQNRVRFTPPGTDRESRQGDVFHVSYDNFDGLTYYVEDDEGTKYQLGSESIDHVIEGVVCPGCDGRDPYVNCIDDLCHAQGRCMHGNNTCPTCEGQGIVTEQFREEYWNQRIANTTSKEEGPA